MQALLSYLGILEPYRAQLELPEECELCVREKNGKQYIFILNYSPEEQEIRVKQEMKDMFSGEKICGAVRLTGYHVLCLESVTTL